MFTPQPVVIEPPTLDPDAKGYLLSALVNMALRTLILWGVIAILIPQFGITYWMVYLILVASHTLRGPGEYALMHSMNRAARKRRKGTLGAKFVAASDDTILRARASAGTRV